MRAPALATRPTLQVRLCFAWMAVFLQLEPICRCTKVDTNRQGLISDDDLAKAHLAVTASGSIVIRREPDLAKGEQTFMDFPDQGYANSPSLEANATALTSVLQDGASSFANRTKEQQALDQIEAQIQHMIQEEAVQSPARVVSKERPTNKATDGIGESITTNKAEAQQPTPSKVLFVVTLITLAIVGCGGCVCMTMNKNRDDVYRDPLLDRPQTVMNLSDDRGPAKDGAVSKGDNITSNNDAGKKLRNSMAHDRNVAKERARK